MNFFLIYSPSFSSYFIHSIYAYLLTYLPRSIFQIPSPPFHPTPHRNSFFHIFSSLHLHLSFFALRQQTKKIVINYFAFQKSLLHFHNIIKFPKLKSKAQKIHVAVSEYFSLPLSSTESCFDNVYIRIRITERESWQVKKSPLLCMIWVMNVNLFFDVTARQINPKIV